jgi:AcrR family transcriptional regulator
MKHNRSYGVAEPGLTEDVVEFVSRSDFWFGRGEDAPCIQGGYFVVHHMHPPVIFNQVIEKPNRLCYDCQMATKTTRSAILDVAEHHFAYYGYEATSLRAIMKDAGVNIAAINYHFGAKEELYNAVTQRFAEPVVARQLQQLKAAMENPNVALADVLRSFYGPPIEMVHGMGKRGETLSLFLGRGQTEPDPVYSMIDKHYSACRNEFISAFRKLVPDMRNADYQWRFEFMLSLIVTFLTRQKYIRARYTTAKDWKPEEVLLRLITFAEAGIRAK